MPGIVVGNWISNLTTMKKLEYLKTRFSEDDRNKLMLDEVTFKRITHEDNLTLSLSFVEIKMKETLWDSEIHNSLMLYRFTSLL